MRSKVDERNSYAVHITDMSKDNREKRYLEEAEEVLQDFDKHFILGKLSCKRLPGNTIICHEMDLFELYICVIMKEIKRGISVSNVTWCKVVISNDTVVYPYIEEIWDTIAREYSDKICSRIRTKCVFSRRLRRCEIKSDLIDYCTSMEADLIFGINGKDTREKRYDDLIVLLCIYSKELYDSAGVNNNSDDLSEHVKQTVDKVLEDYYNRKTESEIAKKINYTMMKRREKVLEKFFSSNEDGHMNANVPREDMFWERITVCGKWKADYVRQSRKGL